MGDLFEKDEPVATHLFKLLAPADLNTLALALALLRERTGGLHRALYGLFEDGVPSLGGGGLPSADEQMLATASNRSDVLAHYRQQSVWGLEEAPEWVVQLAARCFDDWESFAANFWVLSQELYCASRDYFEANLMDRDPGPPFPPLFFSRSVALHYAAAVPLCSGLSEASASLRGVRNPLAPRPERARWGEHPRRDERSGARGLVRRQAQGPSALPLSDWVVRERRHHSYERCWVCVWVWQATAGATAES